MSSVKKVLLIDDDKEILENLSYVLRSRHHIEADICISGEQALKVLKNKPYDVVIVDLMLPGIDGHKICQKIRQISDVPIIMITALQDVSERLLAFEFGVDDFLVKPFNINELVARLEAIYKRINSNGKETLTHKLYHFAGWTLNTAKFTLVSASGFEVALSSSDYKLLEAFLEHPNRILSRDYLMEYTHNRSREGLDRSIDVRVSLLRKKLQHNSQSEGAEQLIKTIHSQGYLFTAKVDKETI